jgi:hypothetical protein
MKKIALPLLITGVVFGQATTPASKQSPASKTPAPPTTTSEPSSDAPTIAEDDLLVIKQIPYQPKLVRDPFSAPTDVTNGSKGDLIDDLGVKGRIVSNGKVMAVISDSRGNIRTLPVGYKFKDGELFEITDKAVIFHQRDVNSTTSTFRTVVKPFKREEGK